MADLDERTSVKLSHVVAAMTPIAAAVLWLSSIQATALHAERVNDAQQTSIERNAGDIRSHREEQMKLLYEIRESVIQIQAELKSHH